MTRVRVPAHEIQSTHEVFGMIFGHLSSYRLVFARRPMCISMTCLMGSTCVPCL